MPVEFIVSERQYLDHLPQVYKALPDYLQGLFHVSGELLQKLSMAKGIPKEKIRVFHLGKENPVLTPGDDVMTVAIKDARLAKECGGPRKRIYMGEHGCGQTYNSGNGSYAGGLDRGFLALCLVPGDIPYKKQIANYPNIPCVRIGCPKLDFFKGYKKPDKILQLHEMTIGISFHYSCTVCPETGTAWPFFWNSVAKLIRDNPETQFLGHAHPRAMNGDVLTKWLQLQTECSNLKVTDDFNHILVKADLYIMDQSSTIFEFAALDKPVILMNSPHFRKNVHHGMRFWELADIGVNVEYKEDMEAAVKRAILGEMQDSYSAKRKAYTQIVYSVPIGEAAQACAQAIIDFRAGKLGGKPVEAINVTAKDQPKPDINVIKMRALKMLIQDEGTIVPGMVFQPGYQHSYAKGPDGKTIAVPGKKICYIDPYTRASAMAYHQEAEYVYEELPIPPEEQKEMELEKAGEPIPVEPTPRVTPQVSSPEPVEAEDGVPPTVSADKEAPADKEEEEILEEEHE